MAFFMSDTLTNKGFEALGIPPSLLQKLTRLGFTIPTPIQEQSIPEALGGRDIIGIAQTGTGKTLAFGIPMIANLRNIQQGLVLAPTRELALQIDESLQKLGVKTAVLIGGAPMGRQIQMLRSRPTMNLSMVQIVVLDEADRMFDMGFAPAIKRILNVTPATRQTMLFSATMPKEICELASTYTKHPVRIEIARAGTVTENIQQELYVVEKEDKPALLKELLNRHDGTVLVFSRTRYGAEKLARMIRANGHTVAELHSDRTLPQRIAALKGFKNGEYRVLVATDIAARGIDVKEIELVLNFDLPANGEDYVHRIGRTARAGASGRAITFASPDQHRDVRDIEKVMKADLPLSKDSRLQLPAAPVGGARQGGGSGRRSANRKPSGLFRSR